MLEGAGFVLVPKEGVEYCTASDVGETASAETALCDARTATAAITASLRSVLNLLKCIFQQNSATIKYGLPAILYALASDVALVGEGMMQKDLFEVEAPQKHACIECAKFAGRDRDRTAFLFRTNRGYCNDDRHPGGIWNVVQSITSEKDCPYFEAAPAEVVEARRRALQLIKSQKPNQGSAARSERVELPTESAEKLHSREK